MTSEQQQALDALPAPASLDRITRFLSDLGQQGNAPLGASGRSAQAFAASLAGGAHSFSARQASGWVAILMDRYQIKMGEIQEFALWFVRRQEILSQTSDLVERAPEPVLARPQAPDPVLAMPPAAERASRAVQAEGMSATLAADGPAQAGYTKASPGAPPPRTALRRQAVTASPDALPPSEGGRGREAQDAEPDATEERPRRRQADSKGQTTAGSARRRRIERGPVRAGDDAPPGDATGEGTPQTGMPEEEAPPAKRPFRLMPHMITRPAFVTNVGLAGMLAGLTLSPGAAMAQDAPDMALALPQMLGSGPMGGPLPMYPPFAGAGPMGGPLPMSPAQGGISPLGVPAFTPTVTPLASAAVAPPSTVWLGMPAPAPPPPDADAPGSVAFPATRPAASPGIASPTPPAPDMTLLPGVSPETLGIQAIPPPQAVGTQPPVSAFVPQTGVPRLPSDGPASSQPPVAPPAPTNASPDAALPPPTPQSPALMGLAAGSAALAAAEQLGARQPQAAPSDQATPGDATTTPTGVTLPTPALIVPTIISPEMALPSPPPQPEPPTSAAMSLAAGGDALAAAERYVQAAPPVPSASPPDASRPASAAPALAGLVAGSAALAVADRFRSSHSPPALGGTRPLSAGASLPPPGAGPSPMTVFLGSAPRSEAPDAAMTSAPPSPFAATPEMGQLTLLAPPLQIASAQAERGGIAASVDWQTLAGGAGPLDEGGLARLKQVLPAQASVLYPALKPGSLGPGAVNLPLSAPLVQSLLQKSYGGVGMGMATRAADMAASLGGGKPAAAPLPAQIVPGRRPSGTAAGVLGHPDEVQGGAGALGQAGKGQATRGGVLDFLGLPVRLAPSLGGRSDLARETTLRNAGQGPVASQQTLRPEQFAPLRNRLFPAFSSMAVEPDKGAWRRAAPAFGLRDGSPTTLLSPDARVPVQTPTMPQPPSRSRPPASSRSATLSGSPFAALSGGQYAASLRAPSLRAASLLGTSAPTPTLLSPSMLATGHKAPAVPGRPSALGSSLAAGGQHTPDTPMTHGLGAAMGALPRARTPLDAPGGAGFVPPHSVSLPFPSAHPLLTGRNGTPLTASQHVLAPLGPAVGRTSGIGHHLDLGPSHHPLSSHTLSSAGSAHLPSGPTHGSTRHGPLSGPKSSPGFGPLVQHSFAAPPNTQGGMRSLPATARGSYHAGRGPLTAPPLTGSRGRASGHRLPLSSAFVPAGGRSAGHSRHAHANARPWGDSLSLPTPRRISASHSVPAPDPSLGFSHTGGAGGHRGASHLSAGLPLAALALPHRAVAPTNFPDSRLISSPHMAAPFSARAASLARSVQPGGRPRGAGVAGGFNGPAPAMRLAPRALRRPGADTAAMPPMTIQRSETTASATPAQNRSAPAHAHAPSGPSGSATGEVNALAGEVWGLLKRRLATEAERRGR